MNLSEPSADGRAPDANARSVRVFLLTFVAAVVSVLIGVAVGAALVGILLLGAEEKGGFADLAAVVVGLLVGGVVAVVAWVVALVRVARRLFGVGHRRGVVLAAVGAGALAVVVLRAALGTLSDGVLVGWMLVAGILLVAVVVSSVFVMWDRRVERGRRVE